MKRTWNLIMPLLTPLKEIETRIGRLQAKMALQDMDGAIVIQRADLFYLSGTGQDAHLFVPAEGDALLMVRKSFERAVQETPLENVSLMKRLSDLRKTIRAHFPRTLKRLGMELDVLPVNNYRVYAQLFPEAEITDVSVLIRAVRMIKSPFELELMRQAAHMTDSMYRGVKDILREGMTEIELAACVELHLRKQGHQGLVRVRSFNQDVFYGHIMSGSNLALPSCSLGPTGGPGTNPSFPQSAGLKTIRRHEPVQIDYVGIAGGYIVDQARTFFFGKPPDRFREVHAKALDIQAALVDKARPGARGEHLYNIALSMAKRAGLEENFMGHPQPVPFVGHGIGLELDELPVLGKKSPHVLEPGMVIALEPKFILPRQGLAGIENSFLITENSAEKLSNFPDDIQVVG